jgi:hypothetical protein
MLRFKLVYSEDYALPLGEHVFPGQKYRLVHQYLFGARIADPDDFVEPEPARDEDIQLAHTSDWVQKLRQGKLSNREELLLEMPYSEPLVRAFWLAAGGSMLAAQLALRDRVGISLGGGFHHAFPDHGEGFCMINDVAIAVLDPGAQPGGSAPTAVVDDEETGYERRTASVAEQLLLLRAAQDGALSLTHDLPSGWTRALITPLEAEGRRLGAVLLATRDKHRRLGQRELTLLTPLASALAVALRGAAHVQRLTEETSKLKAVVDQSSDGILVLGSSTLAPRERELESFARDHRGALAALGFTRLRLVGCYTAAGRASHEAMSHLREILRVDVYGCTVFVDECYFDVDGFSRKFDALLARA